MPADAQALVLGDAAELEILHALEKPEQLLRQRVVVEAGTVEGDEQFVRGFERRKATRFGLPLDDIPAGRGVRKHDPWQSLQAEARAQHGTNAAPRGIQQEHHEAPTREIVGVQFPFREIACVPRRVEQHGEIIRIVQQGLHGLMSVEPDANVEFAVRQAQVREPAGARFHAFEFIGVHEDHELRARRHGRDRAAPAKALRPKASVAHFATHG